MSACDPSFALIPYGFWTQFKRREFISKTGLVSGFMVTYPFLWRGASNRLTLDASSTTVVVFVGVVSFEETAEGYLSVAAPY